MADISILCPTRNRPSSIIRLVESARGTSSRELQFVFYTDEDDTVSASVIDMLGETKVVGPRIVLSEMWNRCFEKSSADILMHCGDDIVFRTQGWDTLVLEEFEKYEDKIILVYGKDGIQDQVLGTHSFIHRDWVEAVGYFVPPYFSSDYNDTWLNDVAESLGRRRYLPEIYTEHMHPVAGKAEWDLNHKERLERHERDGVASLYERLLPERIKDTEKLLSVINNYKENA